jgi:hypothetical protein
MHHEKSKKLVKSKSPKKVEQAGSTVEINQMKFLIYHILTKEHLFKSFIFNLQYIHTCGKTSFYFIIRFNRESPFKQGHGMHKTNRPIPSRSVKHIRTKLGILHPLGSHIL